MTSITETILSVLSYGAIGSLLTFFVTVVSQKKHYVKIINEAIKTHIKINHKDLNITHIEEKLKEGYDSRVETDKKIDRLTKIVTYIAVKGGADLKDLEF